MSKYYLVHAVRDPEPKKILKILKDGYLYASSYSKQYGIFYGEYLDYVYFSLLGDSFVLPTSLATFILSTNVLYKRSFRYALTWAGNEIQNTTKVNYRYDNVYQILDKINKHIVYTNKYNIHNNIGSHEILLKKKVNLHNYLVAICCGTHFTPEIIKYINQNYPNVKIINKIPKSAHDFNVIINP